MEGVLERLKQKKNRDSTKANYLAVWRNFNNFLIKLDRKPEQWEDRVCLFGAYMVQKGVQSSTLKSYFSAIKGILADDGYIWCNNRIVLGSLVKACKLTNDRVKTRLPIQIRLLEILLFEIERLFDKQPYLEILYKTMLIVGYYGMLRVGEITTGSHPVRAKDVHIGSNKNKILLILYTSKTHGYGSKPQKVKIEQNLAIKPGKRYFCPFTISRQYLHQRGNYKSDNEPFFVFSNRDPIFTKFSLPSKYVNFNPKILALTIQLCLNAFFRLLNHKAYHCRKK